MDAKKLINQKNYIMKKKDHRDRYRGNKEGTAKISKKSHKRKGG